MGNYASCTLPSPRPNHPKRRKTRTKLAAQVILPSGETRLYEQTIKAAELMFDTPNFFIVNSSSLQPGRRFAALGADEDLEVANVYVMIHMKRLNSVIMDADTYVGRQIETADAAQVMPEPEILEDDCEEFLTLEFKHKMSFCRSKKPSLETIDEEPLIC